ncbi:MAG: Asp-tRNA(Asn)/Glu-tRNA(Gln) amidotransferase subunit GatB [Candidatus Bilamarchaeum sp.]|jgi:aspartyl-tRNA(Asn)/glutamyl-tRNA(Gln) amidotransferase subunit B
MTDQNVIIGLEIHVQLNTESKLFCSCPTDYGHQEPNTNICPTCSGQIGAKPLGINARAISNAIKIAKVLNAVPELDRQVHVLRKHYFYPDLPSGYQRTSKPIAKAGKLLNVGIWEVHFEEDPGRYELRKGYVDYNRSGVPLAEIVTAPDMRSPAQAKEFLGKLEEYLRYFDLIKDEVGSMRIDANVSIRGGKRVEIKNINSFSNVSDALNFEIKRQQTQLEQGLQIIQETRHFDENSGITIRMRKKETADDYRYVPDPDISPVVITKEKWDEETSKLGELPDERAKRIATQYSINLVDAEVMVIEREFADLFEELARKNQQRQSLANWMRGPLRKQLNNAQVLFRQSKLSSKDVEEVYRMFLEGKITDNGVEKILKELINKRKEGNRENVVNLATAASLLKSVDTQLLLEECKKAIEENKQSVDDYKAGKEKALFFIIGKIIRKTNGRLDAKEIEKKLKELIA